QPDQRRYCSSQRQPAYMTEQYFRLPLCAFTDRCLQFGNEEANFLQRILLDTSSRGEMTHSNFKKFLSRYRFGALLSKPHRPTDGFREDARLAQRKSAFNRNGNYQQTHHADRNHQHTTLNQQIEKVDAATRQGL